MKRLICIALSLSILIGISATPLANVFAAPINLIPNPSVETPNSSNPSLPLNWSQGNWGTNTAHFSYLSGGAEDGNYSVKVQMTSYTSGDAKWYFDPINVTGGLEYNYSDYYISNISTEVVAQYQNANGSLSYQDFGAVPSAMAWAKYSINFIVPSGTTNLTIFHLIQGVGSLQTDNFSLSTTSAPNVSITAPTSGTTTSGSVNLIANATDASGIKSVQFNVDGNPIGTPIVNSPYQYNWNSGAVTNGPHTITATAINNNNITSTSAIVTVNVSNVIIPGANLIPNPSVETPSSSDPNIPSGWSWGDWGTNSSTFNYLTNSGYTGTHSLQTVIKSYTTGDAKWYFIPVTVTSGDSYTYSDYYKSNVVTDVMAVFINSSGQITYQDLGSAATNNTWKQFSANFVVPNGTQTMTIYHLISAVGTLQTDDFSLSKNVLPTVSITSPSANSTVSGNLALNANAVDGSGIKSVQFRVDGTSVGSPIAQVPYQYIWNTDTVANGTHIITVTATNINGKSATSPSVSINVNNITPPNGNLIPNPLLATVGSGLPSMPLNWSIDNWGTNSAKFSYLMTGYGQSRSVKVQITQYNSGDGKWSFDPIPAVKDQQYKFSDYYEANVNTEVDVAFNLNNGTTDYQIIGLPRSSSTWANFTTEFSIPLGTQTFTIYHILNQVGSLTTSDFSLTKYSPAVFSRPLVTITFDDGYVNASTEALPLLNKYGFDSTDFIITDLLNTPGYLTNTQVLDLSKSGIEIASHTITHNNLTLETPTQLKSELVLSQAKLESIIGTPVTDLAYPYGLYDNSVISATKTVYSSARGVEEGLNSKDNFNPYDIKVQNIYSSTTTAQIADWVAQAQVTKTWLVLVYHSVDPNTNSPIDGGIYNITPTQLNQQLAAIKSAGVKVETMKQALSEITPQLHN